MPLQVKSLAEWEREGIIDMLSVVIPAHNEEGHIANTVEEVAAVLGAAEIRYEILVINDNSLDRTENIVRALSRTNSAVRCVNNDPPNGFGFAVRRGLADFRGDVVATFMADGSDTPADLVAFYRKLQEGYDCVFGSRFSRGGRTVDYPRLKLVLNRLGNKFIQLLFRIPCDDISNAFKMYRRTVIAGIQPLLAQQFNLTVRAATQVDRARLPVRGRAEYLDQPQAGCVEVQDQGNGIAVFFYRAVLLPRKDFGARRSADIRAIPRDAAPGMAPLRLGASRCQLHLPPRHQALGPQEKTG
jgi:dolichol-phosphate mannosyltransferase